MDKILENIYLMNEREYDIFKFLVVCLFVAIGVFVFFAVKVPYQLEERQRIIDDYYQQNQSTIDGINDAIKYRDFQPQVQIYDTPL